MDNTQQLNILLNVIDPPPELPADLVRLLHNQTMKLEREAKEAVQCIPQTDAEYKNTRPKISCNNEKSVKCG